MLSKPAAGDMYAGPDLEKLSYFSSNLEDKTAGKVERLKAYDVCSSAP